MSDLSDQSLRSFVEALSSDAPSPGAGAAGAVALALAAGCARKAIAITRRHSPADGELEAAAERLAGISSGALDGAVADAELFTRLMHAISAARRQGEGDAAPPVRERASALVHEGDRVMALAEELRSVLTGVRERLDPVMQGDVAAALALADAFAAIQLGNQREAERMADPLAPAPVK